MAGTIHKGNRQCVRGRWVILKQCSWCGAVRIAGRFRLAHRLPLFTWAVYPHVFSWLSLTIGVSHGACPTCVKMLTHGNQGLIHAGQEPLPGVDSRGCDGGFGQRPHDRLC